MLARLPFRSCVFVCALALAAAPLGAQRTRGAHGPTAPSHPSESPRSTVGPRRGQEHLPQWLNQHSTLPLPEQQRALSREQGFRELPPEVQQRMHNRLSELNSLPPQQRQRILDRTEAMERLNPNQRQQVRGALSGLQTMPFERRRAVARAFRDLRAQPPQEREQTLQSDQFRSQFTPDERSTLQNLMRVEPLLPPQQ